MYSSDSESETDDARGSGGPCFVSTTPLGEPFMRFQGAYLCNLLKVLNEAQRTGLGHVLRWHPKISNALQINWSTLYDDFDNVHPTLVRYKISRQTNKKECVRPTMNRKLREWNFKMICDGAPWVTYIYEKDVFCQTGQHEALPAARRKRT